MAKLIIFSAPSGAGKSTLIRYLLEQGIDLTFSISATSRLPRGEEKNGVEYYFLSPQAFKKRINNGDFLEYEEVYPDKFYGTLKTEVDWLLSQGKNVVFDVDCLGGLSIKKAYGEQALAIFLMPPSTEELRKRLEKRGTERKEVIDSRMQRAEYEISFAPQFDVIIHNDDFDNAKQEAIYIISNFINKK